MKIEVTMNFSKSTPGTYVYQAAEKDAVIPTLYIKKAGMEDGPLNVIKVVVEVGE